MGLEFKFKEKSFSNIFPFYILINKDLMVVSIGKTLEKLYPNSSSKKFEENFSIKRPFTVEINFDSLNFLIGQLIVIECKNDRQTNLRGQIDFIEDTNEFFFLGTPWFNSIENLIDTGLTLHDFAHHDPMTDLLHLMKTQEITNNDLKHLLTTVNKQKEELKIANKAVHDIALFPTQNPDPLIRINFAGDVLQNNPAASKLDFIEFEDRLYRNDFFFKLISTRIDNSRSRWEFSCSYESRDYSLICIPMKEEGYINIYGRDVTQQLIDRQDVERLSTIVQQTKNAVTIANAKGCIEWVNKAFTTITEYDLEDAKGKPLGSFLEGKDTNPKTIEYIQDKILKGEPYTCEILYYTKSGKDYWLRVNAQPIFNKAGKLVQFFAIKEDITIEKQAAAKIEEQKRFYEQILNNIPADIAVFNSSHQYLFLNPMAVKDNDTRKWLIGKRDEDYFIERNKPLSIAHERRKSFNTLIETKKLKSWEEEMPQPNGGSKFIMRNMFPVLNDGNVEMVIGYGIDISDIKKVQRQIVESERRYRDVIDNSLAIITTHDMDGKFISVNPMVSKIFGYTDEEMIGCSLVDFLPENDRAFFEANYLSKIQKEKSYTGTFRVLHKNGSIVYTLFNNFLKEEQGKEPYVIGFAVDITERTKAEKELKLAKKITDDLAQTKQNFLANMSHEIRTPLNAIMGMASQLQKTKLEEEQLFYLETIRSASDNLLVIINDILDLSKIEAGKLSLEKIGFQLKIVVERAMQVMKHKAEEKGIAFTNSIFDNSLSDVLIGDPYRLNQILLNLISNALKFTEKGSVDISCLVVEDKELNQKIKVIVKDTGIGMDESFAQKLFQKFAQEDDSVTRKYGGTGLGMSICKELVELMDGIIYVESKKGKGTSVVVEIDFEKGNAIDIPQRVIFNSDIHIIKNKCILVADDNKMNRLVAGAMLKNYGCRLVQAVDGADAIQKIINHKPDIVLMDVQMPEMDGLEATKIIRNTISTTLPIIALTALAIKGDEQKCKDAGMNDYLTKPFEESELVNIISKWLGSQEEAKKNKIEKELPSVSLFSLSRIEELSQGDTDFINEMIELFIEQSSISVQQMKTAFEKKDTETVKKVAHRFKPTIDIMCIDTLKKDIRELEINADMLFADGTLKEKIIKIELVVSKVSTQLKENKI